MKKAKIKKRRNCWIVYTDRKKRAKCYSPEAVRLWVNVLERG